MLTAYAPTSPVLRSVAMQQTCQWRASRTDEIFKANTHAIKTINKNFFTDISRVRTARLRQCLIRPDSGRTHYI